MSKKAGFTVVEIMVVIAVIAILAVVIFPSVNQGSAQARDAERRTTVSVMQGAIELYRNEHGRYPAGCNDGVSNNNGSWTGIWSGEPGTDWACPGDSAEYIIDLAPEFIPVLPRDPFRDGRTDRTYVYTTNPDGSVYKFMSMNGAEEDELEMSDPQARCGDVNESTNECRSVPGAPTQNYAYNTQGNTPLHCQQFNIAEWGNDYAARGGYAPRGWYNGSFRGDQGISEAVDIRAREYFSDQIRCN